MKDKLITLKNIDIWTSHTSVLLPKDYDPVHKFTTDKKKCRDDFKASTIWIDSNDLHKAAKDQITKLCKDMGLDEKKIKPGFINESGIFMFEYGNSAIKHSLMTISTVAWIKYFFNLE